MICPGCEGAGWITVNPSAERYGYPGDPQQEVDVRCSECEGTGEVEDAEAESLCLPVTSDDFANPDPEGLGTEPEDVDGVPF